MKFHYFVTITLPDEIFPPSPTAHPDDSPERTAAAMAEGLRKIIPTGGTVLPCIGGGTSWTVEQVHRQIGLAFDKGIAEGRPPVIVQIADALDETLVPPDLCPVCQHAAHPDLVCGFRLYPDRSACLCTAMDSVATKPGPWARFEGAKSERTDFRLYTRDICETPLHVVVSIWIANKIGGWLRKLKKPKGI